MFVKQIVFLESPCIVACDGNCKKAWGMNGRPQVQLSDNPEDYFYLPDSALGEAPADPGTYEGGYGKPYNAQDANGMTKWCYRECERSAMSQDGLLVLPDFSKPLANIPAHQADAETAWEGLVNAR